MRLLMRLASGLLGLSMVLTMPALANDISNSVWSESDDSNNHASPNGWTSGVMLPSQVEPTARAMMGAIKRFYNHVNGTATSGGTANAQTLTYSVAPSAYVAGDTYKFKVGSGLTNTGGTTLNVNSLGAITIQKAGVALNGGELAAGNYVSVTYDGTNFQLKPEATVVITNYGADNTGTNDISSILTSLFALTGGQTIYFPEGTYRIACSKYFTASSAISLKGAGKGKSTLKLDASCSPTGDIFSWTDFGNVHIEGITLDLNTPSGVSAQYAGWAFYVDGSNSLIGPRIIDSEVLNLGSSSGRADDMRLSVLNSSAAWNFPIIHNSRFTKASADGTTANNCIDFGGSGAGDSTSLGNIHYAKVTNNICTNSGIQVDGDHGYYGGNDISAWAFGTGIFTIYNSSSPTLPTSDHDNIFEGNILHDSPTGTDVNSSTAACVENNGYRNAWIGNILHDCGGEGFRNYGENTVIQGGAIYNNGKTSSISGNYRRVGVNAVVSGIGSPYKSGGLVINNVAIYDTASTQLYAYGDDFGIDTPVTLTGSISGATASTTQNSAQGTLNGDAWQVVTTTLGCFSGTLSSGTGTLRYRRRPFAVDWVLSVSITTNGSCAGYLSATLPVAADPGANSFDYSGVGSNETTGTELYGVIQHGAPSTLIIKRYDNVYPGADSTVLTASGTYPTTP